MKVTTVDAFDLPLVLSARKVSPKSPETLPVGPPRRLFSLLRRAILLAYVPIAATALSITA